MRLYNTLTREEGEFAPSGDRVKMYVCGITPYAPCHLGHAMSYVIFDVLRRYLEFCGHRVHHVQNFTDVDDKLIRRARETGTLYNAVAERYIEEFLGNMGRLNVKRADTYPRATQEIPRMLEIIGGLVDRGYAYPVNGDVYFRVSRTKDYGKLSRRSLDGMMAGARVEVAQGKEHPMDFALWKGAKPGEPSWASPWGPGRPGWHIECTAMSLGYLGQTLDIHGGGQDLVFPHHENEIAQSEAYTGKTPFARFWVHNGLLHLDEAKMSKSLGNLVTLGEALDRFSPDALRLFFLGSHYRSPLAYSEEGLTAMERAAERLRNALREGPHPAGDGGGLDPAPFKERFLRAMDADLNTPQAIAALFDLARETNRAREAGLAMDRAQATLKKLGDVLGLTFRESTGGNVLTAELFAGLTEEVRSKLHTAGQHQLARRVDHAVSSATVTGIVESLLAVRRELRAVREYALADLIRARLTDLGLSLEDTPQGTTWKHR